MPLRFLVFILLLPAISVRAQSPLRTIQGCVTGADQQPIAYATIRLSGKGIGTAANELGQFVLRFPMTQKVDTLEVSAIGYLSRKVTVQHAQENVTVMMPVNADTLRQVTVTYYDPLKVIAKAISRIPENYITTPHVLRGFYRQTSMKGNTPLQLSEAVFDLFNYGYADPRQDIFQLVKARDDKNERDFHGIEFGQSPGSIFQDDIVKRVANSDILGREGMKRHRYAVTGVVDHNGRPAYEISFSERLGEKEHTFRGHFLVDTATYAFVYFDFGMSPAARQAFKLGTASQRIIMKMLGVELDVLADRDRISYQRMGNKWVFGGDVGDYKVYIKWPRRHYDYPAVMRFNYVVTSVDTSRKTPFTEVMRTDEHINDHDSKGEAVFWKDYNIMLPDRNTEALIRQIHTINQQEQLKARFETMAQRLPRNAALRLDSLLSFYHRQGAFNGTALIYDHGEVLLDKSYGWADRTKNTVADRHTTYRIGSLSKSFTGLIINQLMAAGQVDVHAPVSRYLPWYVHGSVTIEQLLTHQSGIPDYFNRDAYKQQLLEHSFNLETVVRNFCSDTLEFKSGTAFGYSNTNYTVLALVAQQVTGVPFADLLRDRIFVPAGMTDAFWGATAGHPGQAMGYIDDVPEPRYDPGNTTGAGGISAAAADLLHLHEALQQHTLLSKAATDTMFLPRVAFKEYGAWYDYGWMTDESYFNLPGKHTVQYHPGTDLGFFTMYLRVPDTNSCIVLLNNTGDFPRYELADLALGILAKYRW
ncbi:serine hydrolase [Chitinophaga parva]|nr:serine hydrolase [Chitinophaga parva]